MLNRRSEFTKYLTHSVSVIALGFTLSLAQTALAQSTQNPVVDLTDPNVSVDLSVLNDGGLAPQFGAPMSAASAVPHAGGVAYQAPGPKLPVSTLYIKPTSGFKLPPQTKSIETVAVPAPAAAPEPVEVVAAPPAAPEPQAESVPEPVEVAEAPAVEPEPAEAPEPVAEAAPEPEPKPEPVQDVAATTPPPPPPAAEPTPEPAAEAPQPEPAPKPVVLETEAPAAPQPTEQPVGQPAEQVAALTPPPAPAPAHEDVAPPPPPPQAMPEPAPAPAEHDETQTAPSPQPNEVVMPLPPKEEVASLPPATGPLSDGDSMRIVFDADSSKLPQTARDALLSMAGKMRSQEDLRLQLLAYAGNTDTSASAARRLSLSRALAVRSFLIENGVRSTRIDVRALGNKSTEEVTERVDITVVER